MADTIREQIIKDFVTRAETMSVANGYNYEYADNVIRARVAIDPTEIPAVVILPQQETVSRKYGYHEHVMPVRVEGMVEPGEDDDSVAAEKVMGDLIKCFSAPDWSMSPDYMDDIGYTEGGTGGYPEVDESIVGAFIVLTVKYTTVIGDPTSQEAT